MKKLLIIFLPFFLTFVYIFSAMHSFHQVHKSIYYNDKQLSKNYIEWDEVRNNFKDFSNAYDYPDEFFDVIVFRGSLQLIPTPFYVLETCIRLLAPGGYVVFLSTPNSNSPYYRRFKTLPVLTPHGNFLIPSDIMMKDVLQNFGLEVSKISYPYIGGPYANPLRDHFSYFLSFFGINLKFPFWRSSMEIYAYKPLKTDSVPSGEN